MSKQIEVLINQGIVLHQQGRFEEAKKIYQRTLKKNSNYFSSLYLLGILFLQTKDYKQSIKVLSKALQINPRHESSYVNRGVALQALNLMDDALDDYAKAIWLKPDYPEAHYNRANSLRELKRFDEAIESYNKVIFLKPDFIEAHNNRGIALKALRRFDEAIESYNKVIELNPKYTQAYSNRGAALLELKDWNNTLKDCDIAISLKSDYAEAYYNKGNALKELLRFDEAIENFDKSIELYPNNANAYSNRGVAMQGLRRWNDAVASYKEATLLEPEHVGAHWNKGLANLALGNLKEGWLGYEYRDRLTNPAFIWPDNSVPKLLDLVSVNNKKILIWSEQGLGDSIQFCRYLPLLAELGARITFVIPKALIHVMGQLSGLEHLTTEISDFRGYDYQLPLLSLPRLFETTLNSVPSKPSYLKADEQKVHQWASRLSGRNRIRVGLVWSGGFRENRPELWAVNKRRNIPLEKIAQLKINSCVDFFSLQKGEPAESELASTINILWPESNFYNHTSELNDFSDTAAFISNLNLIITVDTSTAHLAGALGKPVWLLNRYDSCWRWINGSSESPWYPSMKIYNQNNPGAWDEVIVKINNDLKVLINADKKLNLES